MHSAPKCNGAFYVCCCHFLFCCSLFTTDFDGVNVFAASRVFKTDLELELLRYINKISSDAHKKVVLALHFVLFDMVISSVITF